LDIGELLDIGEPIVKKQKTSGNRVFLWHTDGEPVTRPTSVSEVIILQSLMMY
jgi:hypothetical protein